jgi:hypothetical protein
MTFLRAVRQLERVAPLLAAQMRVREEAPERRVLRERDIGVHLHIACAGGQLQRAVEEL